MKFLDVKITKGYSEEHKAIDIALKEGTELYAPFPGIVTYGYDKISGNYLILTDKTGQQRITVCHLKTRLTPRDVAQGDLIGYVGNTGRSTGPHAHIKYSLKMGNQFVPVNLLDARNQDKAADIISTLLNLDKVATQTHQKEFITEAVSKKEFHSTVLQNYGRAITSKEKIPIPQEIVEDNDILLGVVSSISFFVTMLTLYKANETDSLERSKYKEALFDGYKPFVEFLQKTPFKESVKYNEINRFYTIRDYYQIKLF